MNKNINTVVGQPLNGLGKKLTIHFEISLISKKITDLTENFILLHAVASFTSALCIVLIHCGQDCDLTLICVFSVII